MTTPRQKELIENLLDELDLDLETALEDAEAPGETLEDMSASDASHFIEWLLREKRSREE